MIKELKQKIKDMSMNNGKGASSTCYCIGDFALLHGTINIDTINQRISIINEAIQQGINIMPILEYEQDNPNSKDTYQSAWSLQQRAKGNELYNGWNGFYEINDTDQYANYLTKVREYISRFKIISNASQEQISKFIEDFGRLTGSELLIDTSKPNNFFYDENEGFTFVDINLNGDDVYQPNRYECGRYIIELLTNKIPRVRISEQGFTRDGITEMNTILPTSLSNEIKQCCISLIPKLREGFRQSEFTEEEIEMLDNLFERKFKDVLGKEELTEEQAFQVVQNKLISISKQNVQKSVLTDQEHKDKKSIGIEF